MAEKSYQVYGYRWVVLGVFYADQYHHSNSLDLFCPHHRACREVLRRLGFIHRLPGHVLHVCLYPHLDAHFMDH